MGWGPAEWATACGDAGSPKLCAQAAIVLPCPLASTYGSVCACEKGSGWIWGGWGPYL